VTRFRIEPLNDHHDRSGFNSSSPLLDRYFQTQVTQDVRRVVTTCFVAVSIEDSAVAGFYTLSAGSVVLSDLPPEVARKLPRYPAVPVVRIGRLAVAQRLEGQKLGAALLWDAARRALSSPVSGFALVVDPKDDHAAAFYGHHGFRPLGGDAPQLFLLLATLRTLLPGTSPA